MVDDLSNLSTEELIERFDRGKSLIEDEVELEIIESFARDLEEVPVDPVE